MKERLDEMMKSKSDRFDEMMVDEERIRLGEEGWKDRWAARRRTQCSMRVTALNCVRYLEKLGVVVYV